MPRLFFAIRTSDEQRMELRRVQKEIATRLDNLGASYKLENIDNSHCTLRFLGNTDQTVIQPLIVAVGREIQSSKIAPFDLTLEGSGSFLHRGKAKVMWAGLTATPELTVLRDAIDRAIKKCDMAVESNEEFHPHLTLLRFREPVRLRADFELPDVSPLTARVTEIELIDSKTLPTGAVHKVIARFAL